MPRAWNKVSYTLLWKGQKLAVTVSRGMMEIVNEASTAPITLEV